MFLVRFWCFEEVPEVEGFSENLRSEVGCRAQWGGSFCHRERF